MKPIASVADWQEVLSQPRALVLLWVNWSVHARLAKNVVEDLRVDWEIACPELPIAFSIADLSDQSGDVWEAVRAWLAFVGRPVDALSFGGVGSLLWLRDGGILAHALTANNYGRGKLFAVTRAIFAA